MLPELIPDMVLKDPQIKKHMTLCSHIQDYRVRTMMASDTVGQNRALQ